LIPIGPAGVPGRESRKIASKADRKINNAHPPIEGGREG
jgi:hypothetical protein